MIHKLLTYYKHQQFFPGIISILINPFFFFRLRLVGVMKKYSKELNGRLLDFGCGCKPYQELFEHVSEYIGVDIENEGHNHEKEVIDVYYDGHTLPFEDESFDSVLSNEVLEHAPILRLSLSEIRRVLKPGGKILLTVPFVCFEHELPFDFRRLTIGGLIKELEDAGFKVTKSEKTGNYVEVVVQLWISYWRDLLYTRNKYVNMIINTICIAPFTLLGLLLSLILPERKGLYFDTLIVGHK